MKDNQETNPLHRPEVLLAQEVIIALIESGAIKSISTPIYRQTAENSIIELHKSLITYYQSIK